MTMGVMLAKLVMLVILLVTSMELFWVLFLLDKIRTRKRRSNVV